MKRVFSHPNSLIVGSMAALLAQEGIETEYRNEFLGGGAGELAPGETWMELWVVSDRDAERATGLIDDAQRQPSREEWRCNHCGEANPATFDVCWQCGKAAD